MSTDTQKHTPGPWETALVNGRLFVTEATDTAPIIAEIWRKPNEDANASLIAAAPDLLEALKACERYLSKTEYPGHRPQCALDAVKAIARAEGRA